MLLVANLLRESARGFVPILYNSVNLPVFIHSTIAFMPVMPRYASTSTHFNILSATLDVKRWRIVN